MDDLDVAAADLELQGGTEMPQAVEDDGCQVILIGEFSKPRPRFGVPHRACRPDCNDQAIVSVFITIQQFQRILGFFDIPKGQGYFLGRKIVRTLPSVFGDFRTRDVENCGFFCSGKSGHGTQSPVSYPSGSVSAP